MRFPALTLAACLTASAASAQTYDFTGVVTEYNQYQSTLDAIGTPVTGSFTIDYANAQSFTAPPGSATFTASETSGPYLPNLPPAPPPVFSMTLRAAGGVFYLTPTGSQALANVSNVSGSQGILSAAEQTYVNFHSSYPTPEVDFSSLSLHGFTPNGLPASGASGTGRVEEDLDNVYYNTVEFTISNLVRAPELDPSAGVTAVTLLTLLGLMASGRSAPRRALARKWWSRGESNPRP